MHKCDHRSPGNTNIVDHYTRRIIYCQLPKNLQPFVIIGGVDLRYIRYSINKMAYIIVYFILNI